MVTFIYCLLNSLNSLFKNNSTNIYQPLTCSLENKWACFKGFTYIIFRLSRLLSSVYVFPFKSNSEKAAYLLCLLSLPPIHFSTHCNLLSQNIPLKLLSKTSVVSGVKPSVGVRHITRYHHLLLLFSPPPGALLSHSSFPTPIVGFTILSHFFCCLILIL